MRMEAKLMTPKDWDQYILFNFVVVVFKSFCFIFSANIIKQ